MPVRLLNSSVMKWPSGETVHEGVCHWAENAVNERSGALRMCYFGSYARGDWGVGSDVDLIVVVREATLPFRRRSVEWDTTGLRDQPTFQSTPEKNGGALEGRFRDTVDRQAVWGNLDV